VNEMEGTNSDLSLQLTGRNMVLCSKTA